MNTFKLKVKLDPAKHAIPHVVARKDPKGYTCACVISQAVNDAIAASPGRFRRWERAFADTGTNNTTIHIKYKDGTEREYNADLPEPFYAARLTYDDNRGKPPEAQEPIEGATRTLTFKKAF